MNKVMYIAINKEIDITPGTLAEQVGHAIAAYIYHCNDKQLLDDYMNNNQTKVLLACSQNKLEKYEQEGYISVRDAGKTELEPNTLTCVNLGIYDKDLNEVPKFIKRLQLYKKDSYNLGYEHGVIITLIGLVKNKFLKKIISDKIINELEKEYKGIKKKYEEMITW